jgi:hypothetical protein
MPLKWHGKQKWANEIPKLLLLVGLDCSISYLLFITHRCDFSSSINQINQMKTVFETLGAVDCSDKIEKKNGLSYLSWSWAWNEVKKRYSTANYRVVNFDGKPYLFDEHLGYLVQTEVTIDGETIPMQLPIMDNVNRAQRHILYQQRGKDVQPATMFDINTAIMRCLVKNLAMFGLGLYIYSGEDLPMIETEVDLDGIKAKLNLCNNLEELGMLYDSLQPFEQAKSKALFTKRKIELNGK